MTTFHHVNAFSGFHSLLLSSSPSSEDGHVRVCPGTTVTLTCTASQVTTQGWRDQNGLIHGFSSTDDVPTVVQHAPYTLTLVAVDDNDGDDLADFTSTLEVMVDNIANGTNISCSIFQNQERIVIIKTGKYAFTNMLLFPTFSLLSFTLRKEMHSSTLNLCHSCVQELHLLQLG